MSFKTPKIKQVVLNCQFLVISAIFVQTLAVCDANQLARDALLCLVSICVSWSLIESTCDIEVPTKANLLTKLALFSALDWSFSI